MAKAKKRPAKKAPMKKSPKAAPSDEEEAEEEIEPQSEEEDKPDDNEGAMKHFFKYITKDPEAIARLKARLDEAENDQKCQKRAENPMYHD